VTTTYTPVSTLRRIRFLNCTAFLKSTKKDVPFRPIVDYTGSIGYNSLRFLADILNPLIGKSDQFVKKIPGMFKWRKMKSSSHDVVSLFTNTPVKGSLEVIRERLQCYPEWRYTTLLEVDDIMELLEFILTTTYFCFSGQIYRQKFGTAMGSPVSPLVANMFMEHLEQKLLNTAPEDLKPKLWKRYVDDILEVVKKGSVEKQIFLMALMTNNIKFTYEVEQDCHLPFLDLLLNGTENGDLKLQIYRKPTYTDHYLNFISHHPIEHKLSVVRTSLERSYRQ